MRYARAALVMALGLGPLCASSALADDLIGLYVGGGLGTSNVRVDDSVLGSGQGFDAHKDGWKLLLGVRPISLVGAEVEYIDFGTAHFVTPTDSFGLAQRGEAHPKAAAAFGVIYAPIPIPLLDVFGKIGVARLQMDVNATTFCAVSPCVAIASPPFAFNRTNARIAYGAGAQFKFSGFAARLEYERVNATTGDPDLMSIGITWSF
jgi:opacity protein-like surface antigen